MSRTVDRVSRLSKEEFTGEYLSRAPVIITDLMDGWKAVAWTFPQLKDRFAGAAMPVQMDDDEFEVFCDATNDPLLRSQKETRRLAVKGLSFWIVKMDAYFDAAQKWGAAGQLPSVLDVPLVKGIMERYLEILGIAAGPDRDTLIAALETLAADVAFPEYLAGNKDYRLWFTPGSRRQGTIHADGYHNLNAQIKGRKNWVLSPQRDSEDKLLCSTTEGQILYIPKGWWHAAAAAGPCVNVNVWDIPPR